MDDKTNSATPRAIYGALWVALVIAIALVIGYLLLLPNLTSEHQTFWSTFIGSAVGSLLAVGGAIFIWRIERKLLIADRDADFQAAIDRRNEDLEAAELAEQKRSDANNVRQFGATVTNLRALNYHMPNETRHSTSRERYLSQIRLQELALTVFDPLLSKELEFMAELADEDSLVDEFIDTQSGRLRTVQDWIVEVLKLKPGQPLSNARPAGYEGIKAGFKDINDVREQNWADQAEWEASERLRLAEERAASRLANDQIDSKTEASLTPIIDITST